MKKNLKLNTMGTPAGRRLVAARALLLAGGLLLSVGALTPSVRADSGIYKGYVVVNSGSGNQFYNLSGGAGPNFQGSNLGTFSASTGTLTLNGFEVDTFKNNGSNVTGAYGDYRFYKTGSTAGSFAEASVPFNANGVDGDSSNQKWQSTGQNTNVLAGPLDVGTYNFEVYEKATTSDGDKYLTNNGANYIATFTIAVSDFTYTGGSGSTALAANWSVNRAPGNGHNLTLASTGTTAITNTLTSANSLAIASTAGKITLTGTSMAVTTTISNASSADEQVDISLSGTASLSQTGSGKLTLTGNNTFSGTLSVSAGTVNAASTSGKALGGVTAISITNSGTLLTSTAQQFKASGAPTLTLGGGTLNTGGTSQTLGALTLSANSTIDLGNGASILTFGSGSTYTGGLLTISNWTGSVTGGSTDEVIFNSTLSTSFLSNIQFSGYGIGAAQLGSGEIVPVPEPATWAGGALCAGLALWTVRRRFTRTV